MKQSTKNSHAVASTFAFSPLNAQRKKAYKPTHAGSSDQWLLDTEILRPKKQRTANFSYPQVRQRWFSVCIFPPGLGLPRYNPLWFHTRYLLDIKKS